MQKITYIHEPSNQRFEGRLPSVFYHNGISSMGINETNMAKFGFIKEVIELPDTVIEEQLPEALIAKEQVFASKLKQFATEFDINLFELENINISTLLQAAENVGLTETQIANVATILLALAKDVEAESGLSWKATWDNLKSRLPQYLQDENL